jgi:hypothetical protein
MSSSRLQQTPDVVARTIADEAFLLPVKGDLVNTAEMFVLSEVGRFIWALVDGSRGVEEMVAAVVAEFDVDEARARADVSDFLAELKGHGLLRETA